MEYIVEQGDSLTVSWELPGVVDKPSGGINLDLVGSTVTLTRPDGEKRVLSHGHGLAITREIETRKITGELSVMDTSAWPLGNTAYEAHFVLDDGTVCNGETGQISVIPKVGEVVQGELKPWDDSVVRGEAPVKVRKDRLKICKACDAFEDGNCLACGCVLEHKVSLGQASCPLGKWGPVSDGKAHDPFGVLS